MLGTMFDTQQDDTDGMMNTWIRSEHIWNRADCQYGTDIWSVCVRNTIGLYWICNKGITTIKNKHLFILPDNLTLNLKKHCDTWRMFIIIMENVPVSKSIPSDATWKWEESYTSLNPPPGFRCWKGVEKGEKLYGWLCTLARVAMFSHSLVLPKWRWYMEHGLQNSRWGWFGPHGNQISHWEVNIFDTFVIRTHQKVKNNPFCIVLVLSWENEYSKSDSVRFQTWSSLASL